jgi:hypothetical protein
VAFSWIKIMKTASMDRRTPLMWRLPRWISLPVVEMCRWGLLGVSSRRSHGGFVICDVRDIDEIGMRAQRVADALSLIAAVDERRLERMRRLANRIIIVPTLGTDGEYWHRHRVLVLCEAHAENAPLEHIAMTLVHEATHARLRKAGIGYDARIRHRVERACIGEELAFARRLPNPETWVELAGAKRVDPEYWSDEQAQQRRVRALPFWREVGPAEPRGAADAGRE